MLKSATQPKIHSSTAAGFKKNVATFRKYVKFVVDNPIYKDYL